MEANRGGIAALHGCIAFVLGGWVRNAWSIKKEVQEVGVYIYIYTYICLHEFPPWYVFSREDALGLCGVFDTFSISCSSLQRNYSGGPRLSPLKTTSQKFHVGATIIHLDEPQIPWWMELKGESCHNEIPYHHRISGDIGQFAGQPDSVLAQDEHSTDAARPVVP